MKGNLNVGHSNSRFRSMLVVIQFVISVALIVGTLAIYQQISFMKNKKLGFNKEHVVVVPGIPVSLQQSLSSVKQELAPNQLFDYFFLDESLSYFRF